MDRHRVPELPPPAVQDSRQISPTKPPFISPHCLLGTLVWGDRQGMGANIDCVLESGLGLARQWSPGKR